MANAEDFDDQNLISNRDVDTISVVFCSRNNFDRYNFNDKKTKKTKNKSQSWKCGLY